MSILIDKNTRVVTQGITGKTGQFHTKMGKEYANGKACYAAGVTPKTRLERVRPSASAAASPIAIPTKAGRIPWRTTSRTTSRKKMPRSPRSIFR